MIISKHREFLITKDDRNDGVRVSKIINVATNSRYWRCLAEREVIYNSSMGSFVPITEVSLSVVSQVVC